MLLDSENTERTKEKKQKPQTHEKSKLQISLRRICEIAPADVAEQVLAMDNFDEAINPNVKACQCPICKNLVRCPVMITKCQHIFCAECLVTSLSSELNCAVCKIDVDPETTDIQPAQLAFTIVCNLLVFCTCGEKIKLQFLSHYRQQCPRQPTGPVQVCPKQAAPTPLFYHPTNNPTARDILSMQPGEAIPPVVEQVLTHGVKMKMAEMPNATYLNLRTDRPQVTYGTSPKALANLSTSFEGMGGGDLVITGIKFVKMLYEFHFTDKLGLESIFPLQEVFILHKFVFFLKKKPPPPHFLVSESDTTFKH